MSNRAAIESELDALVNDAASLMAKFSTDEFQPLEYQAWYTRARRLVALLIPERLKDFEQLYKTDHKIKDLIARYSIEDYLNGMRVPAMVGDSKMLTANRFEQQYAILWSAASQIDPILDKVTAVIKDEVLADELTSARYLAKGNHLRAAGAVAGVVLEKYLSIVCKNHSIIPAARKPTLNDYVSALKDQVLDQPQWRFLTFLADIRNICVHAGTEPSKEQLKDLIDGVDKITSTVF